MAFLSKSLPEEAPRVFHALANRGYDLNTLRALLDVIDGSEQPDISDVRTQESMLLELQSMIANTISVAEARVMAAIEAGGEVQGYTTSTRKTRSYSDTGAFMGWARASDHPEFIKAPEPVGFVVLDKLLKANPELIDEVSTYIKTAESAPFLKRT